MNTEKKDGDDPIVHTTVRVNKEIFERLNRISEMTHLDITHLLRILIADAIKQYEEQAKIGGDFWLDKKIPVSEEQFVEVHLLTVRIKQSLMNRLERISMGYGKASMFRKIFIEKLPAFEEKARIVTKIWES